LCFFIAVALMFWPMFQTFNNLIEEKRKMNMNYVWPKYSDFWISVVAAPIFFLLKRAFNFCFTPLYMRFIYEKYQGKARIERAEKGAKSVFKFFLFVTACIVGWFVLKDIDFMPKSLFCNGDMNKIWKDFPYWRKSTYFNTYYMVQFGYHLESLVSQMFSKPKNDYIEMMLHHIVAVLLISLSYMSNISNVGASVLFLHDWSDIFTALTRVLVDLPGCKVLTTISFFSLVVSWAWSRLYVFPFHVIGISVIKFGTIQHQHPFAFYSLITMLLVLLVLHIYWFYLFMKIAYNLIVNKKQEDLQNQVGVEDDELLKSKRVTGKQSSKNKGQ